jgi:hypothetical protein
MRRYHLGILGVIFAGMALMAIVSPAGAATATGTVNVQWHQLPIINFSLTPNYYTGFGSVLATFGTQPAPTHGPGATGIGTGTVDFGTTLSGDTYLYKYAAHLHVTTNDPSGFYVYGEAATLITNNSDGSTYPTQALYYLASGATSDSNTGFTPGLPFSPTSGMVSGGGDSILTPPTITYAGYPSPVAQTSVANGDFYYDYQFKVPGIATGGNYYVWIVYTVVGQ